MQQSKNSNSKICHNILSVYLFGFNYSLILKIQYEKEFRFSEKHLQKKNITKYAEILLSSVCPPVGCQSLPQGKQAIDQCSQGICQPRPGFPRWRSRVMHKETCSLLSFSKATGRDWANKLSSKVSKCFCCLVPSHQPSTIFSGCYATVQRQEFFLLSHNCQSFALFFFFCITISFCINGSKWSISKCKIAQLVRAWHVTFCGGPRACVGKSLGQRMPMVVKEHFSSVVGL